MCFPHRCLPKANNESVDRRQTSSSTTSSSSSSYGVVFYHYVRWQVRTKTFKFYPNPFLEKLLINIDSVTLKKKKKKKKRTLIL
jgi:hypothetical protein